ncbi:MAG: efflux RND transporter periplasmic adaptor subunit [Gallionellaceae bacterium]|nr:efflux RND transporter periplasmic adaptor subunit [Gallionellaceae bacterium]
MNRTRIIILGLVVGMLIVAGVILSKNKSSKLQEAAPTNSALTVTIVSPDLRNWPQILTATGNVQAWQEAIIGAEVAGLRLAEVSANVGDAVKKGQLLARFSDEMVLNDLEQYRAAVDEARARLAEAEVKEASAKKLQASGMMSEHAVIQNLTAAQVARAELQTAEARLQAQKLKLGYTRVVAPDDGLISSRTATVGAVMQPGNELFRLIRRGKLEWRAELPASQLQKIKIGQKATLSSAQGEVVIGVVRRISPVVDMQSRNGSVYVELAAAKTLKAGMYAQGDFDLGHAPALTLEQGAVVVRDGFNYVYQVGPDQRVKQIKVTVGRRLQDRIEILNGIQANAAVVASGAGFLSDGDLVRVVGEAVASSKAK